MAERKAVTKVMALRYRRSAKVEKAKMLDELVALTGWNRDYARRALRRAATAPSLPRGSRRKRKTRRARPPIYDDEVMGVLRYLWVILDFACGKRLSAVMAEMLDALERHGEINPSPELRSKLLAISPATIDRRLAPDRRRMQLKGRSGTKPGSLLKGQIPIKTFSDWDDTSPGFFQADLVGHDGGNAAGIFAQTLTLTDVASGWTEPRALKNKARRWVIEAIDEIKAGLPFALLGIDSDNGSEFINAHLLSYCEDREITFTRGRPYRKNDSAHVEQKNWAVVRQAVGYARYETDEELAVLAELYGHLRLLTNFFCPQAKLVSKSREGARVIRRHDRPTTPYRRLLDSAVLTKVQVRQLSALYRNLNPAQLRRDVAHCQRRLRELTKAKAQIA